jgi:hypothetical protein
LVRRGLGTGSDVGFSSSFKIGFDSSIDGATSIVRGLDRARDGVILVVVSGKGQRPWLIKTSRLDDQATTGGFVVVYPDPVGGCWLSNP